MAEVWKSLCSCSTSFHPILARIPGCRTRFEPKTVQHSVSPIRRIYRPTNQGIEAAAPDFHPAQMRVSHPAAVNSTGSGVTVPKGRLLSGDTATRFSWNGEPQLLPEHCAVPCSETRRQEEDIAFWQRGLTMTIRRQGGCDTGTRWGPIGPRS